MGRYNIKNGFTLMELLIVIALIGILVTMGMASYQTAQAKSRDARRKADMKVLQNALEQYYSDNNATYPDNINLLDSTYLPGGLPEDPKPAPYAPYEITLNAAGPLYYCACAKLEDATQGNSDSNVCGSFGSCTDTSCTHYCVRNLQ